MLKRISAAGLLFVLSSLPAFAGITILHFDELPGNTPVNGLAFEGIHFGYSFNGVASPDAIYGASNSFNDPLLQDPELSGPAEVTDSSSSQFGVLKLTFDAPTDMLQFALALATSSNDFATLTLSDALGNAFATSIIATSDLGTCPGGSPCPSEGLYTYNGSTPIGSVALSFQGTDAPDFALDNLEFDETPEPSTFWVLGSGAVMLLAAGRRRSYLRACSVVEGQQVRIDL